MTYKSITSKDGVIYCEGEVINLFCGRFGFVEAIFVKPELLGKLQLLPPDTHVRCKFEQTKDAITGSLIRNDLISFTVKQQLMQTKEQMANEIIELRADKMRLMQEVDRLNELLPTKEEAHLILGMIIYVYSEQDIQEDNRVLALRNKLLNIATSKWPNKATN